MSSPKAIDLILAAPWILPIVPQGKVFENCAIAIDAGVIIELGPRAGIEAKYRAEQTIQLDEHVLMPGLVNAHGHAPMALMRGLADDRPLQQWLQDHIWPAEGKWLNEDFVRDGSELACAEMLLSGTTCFGDMYFFPEVTAAVVQKNGMRAHLTFPILDFPTAWGKGPDEYLHKGLALHDQYRSSDRIAVGFGPHAPYTISDAPLERIRVLAEETQSAIHIHLHETPGEVAESVKQFGERPIERLHRLGLLSPLTHCVHMTEVNDTDLNLLVETSASVVHCPESNMKLASGLCPVQKMLDREITVGLGTDGAASNNDLDMFGELATAAMVGKIASMDARAVNATQALTMATLGSAKALGLDRLIGSLEPGKQADIIAFELGGINALPRYDLASHLVYNNRQLRVTHSWVQGRCLMHNRQLTHLDLAAIQHRAHQWQQRLAP